MYLSLSGESIAMNVIDKVNSRQKSLHRQNCFLASPLRRLLPNAPIQPFFDNVCKAWFWNLPKRHKISAWGSAYSHIKGQKFAL